ncbi:MAG: hypothetical protein HS116_21435 [Planctomycetes bacterium]|nr:hypothetical protein [Planctomycetota bacterium]
MARRPARRAEPAPAPEVFDDEEEVDEEALIQELQEEVEEGEEEDGEYVSCPICSGRGGACRFCEGYGDVHPDDVAAIREAHAESRNRVLFLSVGGVLFAGAAVAVLMVVLQPNKPEEAAPGTGTPAAGATSTNGAGGTGSKQAPPTTRSQEVAAIIADMAFDLKHAKKYDQVIVKGEAALGKTQDPIQRANIERMIAEARKKLGQ